jgi:SAM-dependent MidA family methyltransferase
VEIVARAGSKRVEADASALQQRLVNGIRRGGPITFAEFMESALYHRDLGFYARPPVGESGHFITAPHVSPAFGDLLARQVAECWELLGRPRPFTLVELGAGDGTLALQITMATRAVPDLAASLRYVAVERSPGARNALSEAGIEAHPDLRSVGPGIGCVLANEVLDNVPFHRLRQREGRVVEVLVGEEDGRLVEVEGSPSPEALAALRSPLGPGEERPVSPRALTLIRDMAASIDRGYSFLFDYGFRGTEGPGPVHSYREHRVLAEVLDEPGTRDITAGVDLEAVAEEARRAGLQAWGPVPQREALLALGYRLWASGVRMRQAEAEAAGDWKEANRLFEARSRASILIDGAKLGGAFLLAFGTEDLPPPAAVLGDREKGC